MFSNALLFIIFVLLNSFAGTTSTSTTTSATTMTARKATSTTTSTTLSTTKWRRPTWRPGVYDPFAEIPEFAELQKYEETEKEFYPLLRAQSRQDGYYYPTI